MFEVGIGNDELYVGSMKFPDRKRHSLVVQRGNQVYVIGQFKNIECLGMFSEALKQLLGGILEVRKEDGK
jgi:hypothetical protein